MQGKNEVGYEVQRGPNMNMTRNGDEITDHLNVFGMVNLLANDAKKLVEEIGELRAQLAPILSEQKTPPVERRATPSARCKMADEMAQVQLTLQQAHEMVYLTLAQLDL